MNTLPNIPTQKTTTSGGESFSEVFAGTMKFVAQSSGDSTAATTRNHSPSQSQSSEAGEQAQGTAKPPSAEPGDAEAAAQSAAASIHTIRIPGKVASSIHQVPSSEASQASAAAAKILPQLSSTDLAAKIAASVVLPQPAPAPAPSKSVSVADASADGPGSYDASTAVLSAGLSSASALCAAAIAIPAPPAVPAGQKLAQSSPPVSAATVAGSGSEPAGASVTPTIDFRPASPSLELQAADKPQPPVANNSPLAKNEIPADHSAPAKNETSASNGAVSKSGQDATAAKLDSDPFPQQGTELQPAPSAGAGLAQNAAATSLLTSSLTLPAIGLVPDVASTSSPRTNATSSTHDGASIQPSPASAAQPASAGGAGKSSSSAAMPATSDSSEHIGTSGSQSSQSAQPDASQSAATSPKAADAVSVSILPSQAGPALHDPAPASSRVNTEPDASAAARSGVPEAAETAPASGINTAHILQDMNQSEMRIGVHSADFGDISIRTSITPQQMMAQISVDHSDLGKAISAHIPAVQDKLGNETGLRAVVEVNQSAMSFSGDRGYSSQREQRPAASSPQPASAQASSENDQLYAREGLRAVTQSGSGYRLDIRA